MSTEYEILKLTDGTVISLDEHSNVLDLCIEDLGDGSYYRARDLEPAQVVTAALNMLKVASYWMNSVEFHKALKSYAPRNSYEASMMRNIGRAASEDYVG